MLTSKYPTLIVTSSSSAKSGSIKIIISLSTTTTSIELYPMYETTKTSPSDDLILKFPSKSEVTPFEESFITIVAPGKGELVSISKTFPNPSIFWA